MSILLQISKPICCLRSANSANSNVVSLIFVRWRKPRWVPKAKSKIYRVRTPTVFDPDEEEFKNKHLHIYQTELKSVRAFLVGYAAQNLQRVSKEDQDKIYEAEWQTMVEKNNAWNNEVRALREKDMALIEKKKALTKELIKERDDRERMEQLIQAEQRFLKEKEQASSFITPEDLDTELDRLLNTRTDYDFALKPDGTTIRKSAELEDET